MNMHFEKRRVVRYLKTYEDPFEKNKMNASRQFSLIMRTSLCTLFIDTLTFSSHIALK